MTTADRRAQARQYARRKRQLWLVDLLWTLLCVGFLQMSGWSAIIATWAEATWSVRWGSVALYGGVIGAILFLTAWPLAYYGGFVLEHRFGLSNQTLPQWLWRQAKQLLLAAPLGFLFIEGLYLFIDRAPRTWWLWLAVAWWLVSVFLARILPTVIIPLFYTCTPLDDVTLRDTLKRLSQQVRVPVMGAFRIALSRDTKKANAAVVGWGQTRRVLLADTLLTNFTPEEITSVVAHELGHHRLHHIPVHLVASLVSTGFGFWVLHVVTSVWLPDGIGSLANFPLLLICLTLLSTLLLPVHNGLSRLLERQADRFALEVTQAPQPFIATMRKLAEQNLAELQPARWVEWFFYSHPAIARRIRMGEQFVVNREVSHAR